MPLPTRTPGLPVHALPTPFPRELARARRAALAKAGDPDEARRAFLEARRSSRSLAVRVLGRLDEAYRTDEPELLDRDDTPPELRQRLLSRLDLFHRRLRTYPQVCALVRPLVADVARPRVLEVASGHGELAIALEADLRALGADVLGSDYKAELVALARANALRAASRARFELLDATRLDLPDDAFDLAVSSYVMHHFPFGTLVAALRELRRVAGQAVLVDLARSPLFYGPGALLLAAITREPGCVHDGLVSLRKAWGVEDWRLAIALSGWKRSRIGLLPPHTLVVQLER